LRVIAVAVPRTAGMIGDTGPSPIPFRRRSASVKVSRTPASDTLAARTGPVSEKQQSTKSRLLRWCRALSVPRAAPYGD
jgi:hypothetical protein